MLGMGPAFRLAGAIGRGAMSIPGVRQGVEGVGQALARPAVGVPLALGGSLAATTGEAQAPTTPPQFTPMSRAEFNQQNRRLGARQTLEEAVGAAERSIRESDAYTSLVEAGRTTAARRMLEEATKAATSRWQQADARRPTDEAAEDARLKREYDEYVSTLATQRDAHFKAEDERQRALLNRPFQERHSTVASVLPWASALGGGVLGGLARTRNLRTFNNRVADLGKRWEDALDTASTTTSVGAREQAIATAQRLAQEASTLGRSGPRHTMEYGPAIGLAEGAQLLPSVVDYAASTPGSPLREHVTSSMADPWNVGGRIAQGLGWGLGAAKIGQGLAHIGQPRQMIPTLGPATDAAAQRHGIPPLPPQPTQPSFLERLSSFGRQPSQSGQGPTPPTPTPPNRILPPSAGGPAHQPGVTRYRDPASG